MARVDPFVTPTRRLREDREAVRRLRCGTISVLAWIAGVAPDRRCCADGARRRTMHVHRAQD
jgi:hypothetical protein